jgi:cysteine desulfurase
MSTAPIYLDHNATTPLDPDVLAAMLPVLREQHGNPSSLHAFGQQARAVLDDARGSVARLVAAQPSEVVFTGSGTEADNLALWGLLRAAPPGRDTLVYGAIEHHAVVHSARALAAQGVPVRSVRALENGTLDLEALAAALDGRTALVAVMLANNETGVLQPLPEVVRLARACGARVHCDAVQAAGRVPIDFPSLEVDTLALSAHKIYGPKGVGALVVRRGTPMKALLHGGAQERNRRAGTENVAGIVGFGRAADIARARMTVDTPRLAALRDDLERRLLAIPGSQVNGGAARVANTTNLSFAGVDAESLLMALDLMGLAVSTGAACAAGAIEPSHVLRGMGLPMPRVQASLRFSLGRGTSADDVARAAQLVDEAIARQRRVATPAGRRAR